MTKSTAGTEATHLKKFMEFNQSTHLTVVSNSVGMALLRLKKTYLSIDAKTLENELNKKTGITESERKLIIEKLEQDKLDSEYEKCVNALLVVKKSCQTEINKLNLDTKDIKSINGSAQAKDTQEKTDYFNKIESINNIIKTTTESIITEWDQLTLYLPDSKEQSYQSVPVVFELKMVLTLVWLALHDDSQYIQHYTGNDKEKLAAAHQDQAKRLESFYNSIHRIRVERLCHTGNRNDLVFTLNQTYAGIDIIEDDKATIFNLLKSQIHDKFWEKYNNQATPVQVKADLQKKLFEWMESNNATKIFYSVDAQSVVKKLERIFLDNGSNPDDKAINLKAQIGTALEYLEFSCHQKEHPVLFEINNILNFLEDPVDSVKNKALLALKKWLLTSCDLSNDNDKKIISKAYFWLNLYVDILKATPLLEMSGNMNAEFANLLNKCNAALVGYGSSDVQQNVSEIIADCAKQFYTIFNKCKQDNMQSYVENFFSNWQIAHDIVLSAGSLDNLVLLCSMLNSNEFKQKIVLTDKDLKLVFVESRINSGEITLTPYFINRIFLHGLLTPKNEWSRLFEKRIRETFSFVKQKFNGADCKNLSELSKSSYSDKLLDEIEDLITGRMTHMFRNTHNHYIYSAAICKDIHAWSRLFDYLNKPSQDTVCLVYGLKIAAIYESSFEGSPGGYDDNILKNLISSFSPYSLFKILLKIEKNMSYRLKNFPKEIMLLHVKKFSKELYGVKNPEELINFLLHCSAEQFPFLLKYLYEKFPDLIDRNKSQLIRRLIAMPSNSWLDEYQYNCKLFDGLSTEDSFNLYKIIAPKIESALVLSVVLVRMLEKSNHISEESAKRQWYLFLLIDKSNYSKIFTNWEMFYEVFFSIDVSHKPNLLAALGKDLILALDGDLFEAPTENHVLSILPYFRDINYLETILEQRKFKDFVEYFKTPENIQKFVDLLNDQQIKLVLKGFDDLLAFSPYMKDKFSKIDIINWARKNCKFIKPLYFSASLVMSAINLPLAEKKSIVDSVINDIKSETNLRFLKDSVFELAIIEREGNKYQHAANLEKGERQLVPLDHKYDDLIRTSELKMTEDNKNMMVKLQQIFDLIFTSISDHKLKELFISWEGFFGITAELQRDLQKSIIQRLGVQHFLSLTGDVICKQLPAATESSANYHFETLALLNELNILPVILKNKEIRKDFLAKHASEKPSAAAEFFQSFVKFNHGDLIPLIVNSASDFTFMINAIPERSLIDFLIKVPQSVLEKICLLKQREQKLIHEGILSFIKYATLKYKQHVDDQLNTLLDPDEFKRYTSVQLLQRHAHLNKVVLILQQNIIIDKIWSTILCDVSFTVMQRINVFRNFLNTPINKNPRLNKTLDLLITPGIFLSESNYNSLSFFPDSAGKNYIESVKYMLDQFKVLFQPVLAASTNQNLANLDKKQ